MTETKVAGVTRTRIGRSKLVRQASLALLSLLALAACSGDTTSEGETAEETVSMDDVEPLDIFDDDETLDFLLVAEDSSSPELAVRAALGAGCPARVPDGGDGVYLRGVAAAVLVAAARDGEGTGNANGDLFLEQHPITPDSKMLAMAREAIVCASPLLEEGYWADARTEAEVEKLLVQTGERLAS